ncbi:MAG: hypothetical protein K2J40_04080 [Ruminococcus sp.]|nr:hypothetical protein [Ruminococcus sp.]
MKNKIKILLVMAFLSVTAGCERTETAEQVMTTETTVYTETVTTVAAAQAEYTERQIVEAICIDMYGKMFEPYEAMGENNKIIEYENDADYLIKNAEKLPKRCLGRISGEEDLTEKARTVFMEISGTEFVEETESEYRDFDGVKMKFERDNPPYRIKYYEDYDVWYIVPTAPSGTREDGVKFAVILDFPPYLLVRGSDGVILGAFR